MSFMLSLVDVVLATIRKDVVIYVRRWKIVLTSLVMPATYILVALFGSVAVGRNPVALVVLDQGQVASQVAQAIVDSDVFRVSRVTATSAQTLYTNLEVGAIITIPAGFSQAVQHHLTAPIEVQSNNLNLDFENDVRRSVPDAITVYYNALGSASPLFLTVDQHNLRPQNIELFQYEVVPLLPLLLLVCGLIASSASTAAEFESLSIKELHLAPVATISIVLGKVLAGWFITTCLGLGMFVVSSVLGWTRPQGIFLLVTVGGIALIALLASTAGIALGCVCRRVQAANVLSTTGSVWVFFLSGGLGVIEFEPPLLRQIAAFDPLTYGIHLLQLSIFYASFDSLGQDILVLGATTGVLLLVCVIALRPPMMMKGA